MRNNKKKGFTLVELLVVIAIIAILATVSVVGYTAFLDKANDSNAVTELTQIKDVVNAAILDGTEEITVPAADDAEAYTVVFTYADGKLTATVGNAAANADQVAAAIKVLAEMPNAAITATITDGAVTAIAYNYNSGAATATWNIANGKVEAN